MAERVVLNLLASLVVLLVISNPGLVLAASDSCTGVGTIKFLVARPIGGCTDCIGGPLQICDGIVWRALCDRNWTLQDATVTCRTLGYSSEGAVNIQITVDTPNPSSTGVKCNGSEANIRNCSTGDGNIMRDGSCATSTRVSCLIHDPATTSTEITTTDSEAVSIIVETTALSSEEEEPTTISLPLTTPSASAPESTFFSTVTGAEQRNPFLAGSGLYIFIGGVGAIVLAIMVLVQILLTCWCCFRFRMKGISPSDAEKQTDLSKEEDNAVHVDAPTEGSTNVGLGSQEHHQLQQSRQPQFPQQPQVHHMLQQSSPNSSVGPIYEPIGGDTSSTRSQDPQGFKQAPVRLVSYLSHPPVSAQEQQPRQPDGFYSELGNTDMYAQIEPHISRPQDSPQPLMDESQYQLLQHKTSSLKRDTKPPVHAVNITALAVEHGLPEHEVVALEYESPIPRKGVKQSPHCESVEIKGSVERHPDGSHAQDTNIYHIIEPPPDYATLEGIEETEDSNNRAATMDHFRVRSLSKSSISPGPSVHSGSHMSLSSSSSSQSPQISRAANNSSPLVANISYGPRVTNKYTESPVPSKKDIIQQGSPNHPDLVRASDRNEMNTLV